eukprot:CAMPEP_0118850102 /NCGR_PEP_ID=MMETSP1163-20130328/117_1 /TAXON_ID=124430 /ORGANISM="Phaeomonas parva, Strain CCMP2877" /LENGTH=500 /DNA_ID=CAMNT_0006782303 /DNA_START=115 /DNA_END=1617 /DNA_ORIENTATION=+
MVLLKLALALAAPLAVSAYTDAALADAVSYATLPGAQELNITFRSFAGYLQLPEEHRDDGRRAYHKNIMYWFFEAEDVELVRAPVTLWTNGGPGCSGFLGLFTEQGPFRPIEGGNSLELNPYRWNRRSHMLFIEQPAGVGFSYASNNTEEAYETGDDQAAEDMFNLILAFFERFPEYDSQPFYITSESYGGHYMPTLAKYILDNNADEDEKGHISFQGFAVGNPYTEAFTNNVAQFETYWGHQIIPYQPFLEWQAECTDESEQRNDEELVAKCASWEAEMAKQSSTIGASPLINPYALDYPVCLKGFGGAYSSPQGAQLMRHYWRQRLRAAWGMEEARRLATDLIRYEPCTENWTSNYLNRPAVKKAIHAKEDIVWEMCSSKLDYSEKDMNEDMAPLYEDILKEAPYLKILVYSGDNDAICATSGTQAWIWGLGYDAFRYWEQWTTADGQLGGFYSQFAGVESFGFATVHRSGHEVPAYTPEAALQLFDDYLSGKWFEKE